MIDQPPLAKIVGKTIAGVVMTDGAGRDQQMYLLFDDKTFYEVSGGVATSVAAGGGPLEGDIARVRELASETRQIVFEATSPMEWMTVKIG